jgi:hypothetical protein
MSVQVFPMTALPSRASASGTQVNGVSGDFVEAQILVRKTRHLDRDDYCATFSPHYMTGSF